MRTRPLAVLAALSLAVAACGGSPDRADEQMAVDATGEMDHSQMAGGAPATRQAVQLTAEQERALGVVYTTVTR